MVVCSRCSAYSWSYEPSGGYWPIPGLRRRHRKLTLPGRARASKVSSQARLRTYAVGQFRSFNRREIRAGNGRFQGTAAIARGPRTVRTSPKRPFDEVLRPLLSGAGRTTGTQWLEVELPTRCGPSVNVDGRDLLASAAGHCTRLRALPGSLWLASTSGS